MYLGLNKKYEFLGKTKKGYYEIIFDGTVGEKIQKASLSNAEYELLKLGAVLRELGVSQKVLDDIDNAIAEYGEECRDNGFTRCCGIE